MLNIPTKTDKEKSILIDAIRILAWSQYKIDNNVSGLQAYSAFEEEWNKHEIHNYDQKKLNQFIKSLGYTPEDLLSERSKYYQRRNQPLTELAPQSSTEFDDEITDDIPY